MSERYSNLFRLTPNLYSESSPIVISAGALLKDKENGEILAQLKMKSISQLTIKAIKIVITPQDVASRQLGDPITFQYLDLIVARNQEFGQKTPIYLPNKATRIFFVHIYEVIFDNNSIWNYNQEEFAPLSVPVLLSDCLQNPELVKQYRLTYGNNSEFMPHKEKDLWICSCGGLNHIGEEICCNCRQSLAILESVNLSSLEITMNERLEIENKKRVAKENQDKIDREYALEVEEENKIKQIEEKKLRMKKTYPFVAILAFLICVFVINYASSYSKYSSAISLSENGQYEQAIELFQELGNYKNSPVWVKETKYQKAFDLLKNEAIDEAITIFEEIGDYKDSSDVVEEIKN